MLQTHTSLPKERETLLLHLMELCICTPGRKLRPVNHSVVRKVSSAHKSLLLFQGCKVPYERLRRTLVRGKSQPRVSPVPGASSRSEVQLRP